MDNTQEPSPAPAAPVEEVAKLRAELDATNAALDQLRATVEAQAALRPGKVPHVTTQERPSLAAKAAAETYSLGRYGVLVIGVLSVLSEAARLWRPEWAGALSAIVRFFSHLLGVAGEPPS